MDVKAVFIKLRTICHESPDYKHPIAGTLFTAKLKKRKEKVHLCTDYRHNLPDVLILGIILHSGPGLGYRLSRY